MPKIYLPAEPDPEGALQWRQLVRELGQAEARAFRPDLHRRFVEHRRWLSHTRETCTTKHAPSKARKQAGPPTPRDGIRLNRVKKDTIELLVTELPLSKAAAKKKLLEEDASHVLPEFIRIGTNMFRTKHWLDHRRHEPISVRKRRAVFIEHK